MSAALVVHASCVHPTMHAVADHSVHVENRIMARESSAFTGRIAAVLVLMMAMPGCTRHEPAAYAPGLGEIMTLSQMRHAKLWLAGQAGNWPLADYEIDELEEGFTDAVTFHPTHKDSPVSIAQVVPIMTTAPIQMLRAAVAAKDREAFAKAFDSLTVACNSCHQATNFGFNRVTTPSGNSFLNQDFTPPAEGR